MGKRKQKIKWCSVDALQWSQDEKATSPEGSAGVVKDSAVRGSVGGARRSSAQGWTSSLAPRFERKAAAEAEQKHIYYEGEFCEAEDLPNGFTKIRSKNLDILFKRDFYEQKLTVQQLLAEQVKSSESSATAEVQVEEKSAAEAKMMPTTTVNMDGRTVPDFTTISPSGSFDQINPNDIQEFKPMNSGLISLSSDIDSGYTSPFYGSYPPHPQYPESSHPHLYLYSPSDNSLIPCEEIIIPNPVMSHEGPVYPGPTNIYLAYPVQGPDGKGYITQPFATPGSYSSQDSANYSPSISYDGSSYYSTTPQDSGSSTQPTSPPPLDTHHPSYLKDNTEQFCKPQPIVTDNKFITTFSSTTTGSVASSATATYIPGLSLDSKRKSRKKAQKKPKKKKVTNSLEQQRSSSSDSEYLRMEEFARHEISESLLENIDPEKVPGKLVPEVAVEPVQEVYLTDDLADSLVNPPTDPELSGEDSQKSISLLSTYSSAEVCEVKLVVADNEMAEEEVKAIVTQVVPDVLSSVATDQSEVLWMNDNVLLEDDNAKLNMENIDILEGEFNASIKCDELYDVPVKKDEGRTETSNTVIKAVPGIQKPKKKTRNQKANAVFKSEDKSSSSQANKKSYSSVIKSNLVKESNNNLTTSCEPLVKTAPAPSTPPHSSDGSAGQENNEQDSSNWGKVFLSSFESDIQEKQYKKRRKNRRATTITIEDSLPLEELPEIEKYSKPLEETSRMQQKSGPEADNLCDAIEVEKKVKKKKFENKNSSHRVIISDDQICTRYSQAVGRASEVVATSVLVTGKSSGFCDFLVIWELGSGISRGCMNYGRLYQGKYIPPERTDGLPGWCEEESVIEEGIAEEVIGEEFSSTASAEIDLD